eukprot:14849_1
MASIMNMYPQPPIQRTRSHRETHNKTRNHRETHHKTTSSSNSAPDPVKAAYKLKSQIDAIEKNHQQFNPSEIDNIQKKLLAKAWKWISKYGLGALNQYSKMKKQITNYDLLVNTIMSMQQIMETNFNALHKINKEHSISLRHVQSDIDKQFQTNLTDKQQIVSLLSSPQQREEVSAHSSIHNVLDDDLQIEDRSPLKKDSDQMIVLHKRLSPIITRRGTEEFEGDPRDLHHDFGISSTDSIPDSSRPSSDTPSYKGEESLQDSLVNLHDISMMKKPVMSNSRSVPSHMENHKKGYNYMDFKCTDQENLIMDDIMQNLTKLEGISNNFNCFISTDSDQYKQETQQMIQWKLKPLHEILEQRELGLMEDLKYLHQEKLLKLKKKQQAIQQNKKYLKTKLVECQQILQQYQTKWEASLFRNATSPEHATQSDFSIRFKHKHVEKNILNIKTSLIEERTKQLTAINKEMRTKMKINQTLEKDLENMKQMYVFTLDSSELHSLKTSLQSLGEVVDCVTVPMDRRNGAKYTKSMNLSRDMKSASSNGMEAQRKVSNILSANVSSLMNMGRNSSHSSVGWHPSHKSSSVSSVDSKMNLNHVNALDALSVCSENHDADDININIRKPRSNTLNDDVDTVSINPVLRRPRSLSVDATAIYGYVF